MPDTATAAKTKPSIPFPIASRKQSRISFTYPTISMGAGILPQTSVEIPATGYLRYIDMQFTVAATGGTPQVTADAPWSLIESIGLRTSDGTPILTPMKGYRLYLINKYGGGNGVAQTADPKNNYSYNGTATAYSFWLRIPFEIDAATGLGSVPALASNRNYQLDLTITTISTLYGATTPPTAVSVNVSGIANYWAIPVGSNDANLTQQTQPDGLGTLARWQLETPAVTPGEKYIKSTNVGGVIGTLIFVTRNASAVRVDSDWPAIAQLYLDNEPQLYLPKPYWERTMSQKWNLPGTTKDTLNSLDNGVYALSFIADGGSDPGDAQGTRAQALSTIDATLLQLYGNPFGATASTLEILTQTISAPNAAFVYAK